MGRAFPLQERREQDPQAGGGWSVELPEQRRQELQQMLEGDTEPGGMPFTSRSLWKDHCADFTGGSQLSFKHFS